MNIHGLTAGYSSEQWTINDVSFSLKEGETLGILGESGSGKTTLVLSLLKHLALPQLPIWVKDMQAIKACGSLRVQYISQNPAASLDPHWRIGKSLAEGGASLEVLKRILHVVGLNENVLDALPNQLSIGQCQRVAIARAISSSPQLLICDEPTSAMDIDNQGKIMALLRKVILDMNLSCIFISHDIHVLTSISNRIAIMQKGKIIEVISSLNCATQEHHPYSKVLLQGLCNLNQEE